MNTKYFLFVLPVQNLFKRQASLIQVDMYFNFSEPCSFFLSKFTALDNERQLSINIFKNIFHNIA